MDTLQQTQKRSLAFDLDGLALFLVSEADHWHAYKNSCPHRGIRLDWDNEQFLDYDEELIQCASHGALFRIDNGLCVAGPCSNAKLQKYPLIIQKQQVYVDLSD
ncbi:Rieske (2Fe-2S) protein [Agaribacterium sp. ZY112]|uniref:Rieske (2Fe-2S) protein n=1 Tax=Agaribacterium sp. ZY112 TaxID=3233574 RepID=UPI003525B7D6